LPFYRVTVGGRGVYEAVDTVCGREDPRRQGKPDGSWLPRVGERFPGALSFWTEAGFTRYRDSGLAAWHASVLTAPVQVQTFESLPASLYEDELQVIVANGDFEADRLESLPFFHLLMLLATAGSLASALLLHLPAPWDFLRRAQQFVASHSPILLAISGLGLAWGALVIGRVIATPPSLRGPRKRRARAAVLAAALSLCALVLHSRA
jgi:hypothetical protein